MCSGTQFTREHCAAHTDAYWLAKIAGSTAVAYNAPQGGAEDAGFNRETGLAAPEAAHLPSPRRLRRALALRRAGVAEHLPVLFFVVEQQLAARLQHYSSETPEMTRFVILY